MIQFTFNRTLILESFAKTDEKKEAEKAEYYKRRNAGLKSYNTRLKNQLTFKITK